MNRRALVASAIAGTAGRSAFATDNQVETLRAFIDTVIAAGDTSRLTSFVTPNVTIPAMKVEGIEPFRTASDTGHKIRQGRFIDYRVNVISIASAWEWAHALVQFDGTTPSGRTESEHVFYVARFEDALIAELYL